MYNDRKWNSISGNKFESNVLNLRNNSRVSTFGHFFFLNYEKDLGVAIFRTLELVHKEKIFHLPLIKYPRWTVEINSGNCNKDKNIWLTR